MANLEKIVEKYLTGQLTEQDFKPGVFATLKRMYTGKNLYTGLGKAADHIAATFPTLFVATASRKEVEVGELGGVTSIVHCAGTLITLFYTGLSSEQGPTNYVPLAVLGAVTLGTNIASILFECARYIGEQYTKAQQELTAQKKKEFELQKKEVDKIKREIEQETGERTYAKVMQHGQSC